MTLAELWDTSWSCIKNKIAPRLSLPGAFLLEEVSHWEKEGSKFRPKNSKMKCPRLPPQGAQASGFRGFGFQRGQEVVWEAGLGRGEERVLISFVHQLLCVQGSLRKGSVSTPVSFRTNVPWVECLRFSADYPALTMAESW